MTICIGSQLKHLGLPNDTRKVYTVKTIDTDGLSRGELIFRMTFALFHNMKSAKLIRRNTMPEIFY